MNGATDNSNLPYDPDLRRETPLALKLKERIRKNGPITVGEYMRACLTDPEHGYYVKHQAIGARGDFVTAPEISQVYGELIGLWSGVVWQQMGSPSQFNLIELGPGRGTMMHDALRAARIVPGFLSATSLILVDVAPMDSVADIFETLVPRDRITARTRIYDIPGDVPMILLANEFLDTCPVQQYVVQSEQIAIRSVGLDANGNLTFDSVPCVDQTNAADVRAAKPQLRTGNCYEAQDLSVLQIVRMFRSAPWAALFLDYGHYDPSPNVHEEVHSETLQAVRNHKYEHPLTSPGEADLTCQVNFNEVKYCLERKISDDLPSVTVDGPVTQLEFLGSLGIIERASRLMSANPRLAPEIELGVARLMAVPGMGDRFKAIGVRSAGLPPLPGFPPPV